MGPSKTSILWLLHRLRPNRSTVQTLKSKGKFLIHRSLSRRRATSIWEVTIPNNLLILHKPRSKANFWTGLCPRTIPALSSNKWWWWCSNCRNPRSKTTIPHRNSKISIWVPGHHITTDQRVQLPLQHLEDLQATTTVVHWIDNLLISWVLSITIWVWTNTIRSKSVRVALHSLLYQPHLHLTRRKSKWQIIHNTLFRSH
jgi:hypothetical protein